MDVELIPSVRQALWGRLALANFYLGGAGTGSCLVAVWLFGFSPTPLLGVSLTLGPLLVVAGFLAVAAEAGRPFRGPRVLRMATSSWMSRELWAGGAFVGLALLDRLRPWVGWRVSAAAAALVFVLAQGWILARCRGVAAWNVPLMPAIFLASALVSGAGVLGLAAPLVSREAGRLAAGMAGLVVVSGLVWIAYSVWPGDAAFVRVRAELRERPAIVRILVAGHLLPLAMLLLGLSVPAALIAATFLSGVAVLIGQLQAKAWLILRAGQLRPITMGNLDLRISRPTVGGEGQGYNSPLSQNSGRGWVRGGGRLSGRRRS